MLVMQLPAVDKFGVPVEKMPECPRCGEDELGLIHYESPIQPDMAFCYKCGLRVHRDESACRHLWQCYGTALFPPTIMLRCLNCTTLATAGFFTTEEWSRTFEAPGRPFIWRHAPVKLPAHPQSSDSPS